MERDQLFVGWSLSFYAEKSPLSGLWVDPYVSQIFHQLCLRYSYSHSRNDFITGCGTGIKGAEPIVALFLFGGFLEIAASGDFMRVFPLQNAGR